MKFARFLASSLRRKARRSRSFGPALRGPQRPSEQGFTLIELLVVIVIIGLLGTIVAINVFGALGTSNVAKAKADISVIESALEQYRLDNLTYPSTSDGLNALTAPPPGLAQPERYRVGGYVKKLPNDPWGKPYQYAAPGRHGAFDVYSLGADGQTGGEGENADIYSSDL
ncbi:general secretion pathway protein G [Sphingobium sp. B2D3A]|uniref:type II secretion system major pseudopilin GspG n=1 Tax=unclassified Sphingobium TaxID=2611147 RepID=UPI002224C735|nr:MULTISPECIES: type II secretion system major pseudopilin GspG [unclassified Sphingobium]MCW2338750.1 general secretion pathway protein G [Sphingobium sp. B2D3A]MCW2349781.1 general secretion pathway protein G [Sphingobium sp. B12D2B]MCW2368898.1 general secretion pathway protein G [Sphingobium sp. B11D3D]MCW2385208.1 general secretion pathway protein G [Sphingobium sp. B2D3D]